MTAGAIFSLLIAAAVLAYLLAPLLRSDAALSERMSDSLSEARELQSRHDMLLASLKDLEDDRATDKIGDADYAELRDRLSMQAIEVMKRLDELKERQAAPSSPRAVPDPEPKPGPTA